MKVSYVISILFLITILFCSIIFVVNKERFIVESIEITADFRFNRTFLMQKVGIEDGNYIWQYNSKKIAAVLDDLYFVDDYKVTKKYPSRLVIQLFKRKPLARVAGKDGEVFFIDRRGVIFKSSKIKEMVPLLVFENPQLIHQGKKLGGKFGEMVQQLYLLSQKYNNLYQQVAQIAVRRHSEGLEYSIDFRIINKTITLKKKLSVDTLLETLVVSKICDEFLNEGVQLNQIDRGYYYDYGNL